jgi:hypothetical protein
LGGFITIQGIFSYQYWEDLYNEWLNFIKGNRPPINPDIPPMNPDTPKIEDIKLDNSTSGTVTPKQGESSQMTMKQLGEIPSNSTREVSGSGLNIVFIFICIGYCCYTLLI